MVSFVLNYILKGSCLAKIPNCFPCELAPIIDSLLRKYRQQRLCCRVRGCSMLNANWKPTKRAQPNFILCMCAASVEIKEVALRFAP